jgi:hypothetical protein
MASFGQALSNPPPGGAPRNGGSTTGSRKLPWSRNQKPRLVPMLTVVRGCGLPPNRTSLVRTVCQSLKFSEQTHQIVRFLLEQAVKSCVFRPWRTRSDGMTMRIYSAGSPRRSDGSRVGSLFQVILYQRDGSGRVLCHDTHSRLSLCLM